MEVLIGRILNPFGWQPEEYDPPVRTGYIHDMMCECQAPRCYGRDLIRWQKELGYTDV